MKEGPGKRSMKSRIGVISLLADCLQSRSESIRQGAKLRAWVRTVHESKKLNVHLVVTSANFDGQESPGFLIIDKFR